MVLRAFSLRTMFRWVKSSEVGKLSVEDDTHIGRPKTSITKAEIAFAKVVEKEDSRMTVKDISTVLVYQEAA